MWSADLAVRSEASSLGAARASPVTWPYGEPGSLVGTELTLPTGHPSIIFGGPR